MDKYLMMLVMLLASNLALAQGNEWHESYALESAGKYAQAAASMEAILLAAPDHEFALMRRAWLNYLQGSYNAALRDYNQVLTLNPKSLEARLGLTLPLLAQQRWREAALEANKVIALSAWDYTAHVRLMVCEDGEHKWEELSRHASELAARYPSDATVLVYLARAEAWKGNVKNARFAYAKVLERMPSHAEAAAYLKKNP
jgi:tetratricopeptide (TPR) repeat protein